SGHLLLFLSLLDAEIGEDLDRRALARLAGSFHEALKVGRAVLTGEVEVSHPLSFGPGEAGPLPREISGITPLGVVKGRPVESHLDGPPLRDPRKNLLKVGRETFRLEHVRHLPDLDSMTAAGVIDQHARLARLHAGRFP